MNLTLDTISVAGFHSAVYHAKPLDGEILYTKIKQTKALENAKQDHTKVGTSDVTHCVDNC